MAIFALCWLAAMLFAYFMTVGLIRAGQRRERLLMVPVELDTDADPRRRRQSYQPEHRDAA